MKKVSFFRDLLVLVGVLPIRKPAPINQEWKRMGYPIGYLCYFSEKKREKMKKDTEKLFELVK